MKLKGLSKEELENLLVPNLLFLGYRGSIAHGMYVPNSDPNSIDDKDVMGIFVASRDHYVGLRQEKETVEKWYNEWDCVYYEIRKIISLLLKGNPNVLSTLWLDERYIIQSSEAYSVLRKSRDIFASKKVYHAFCGYAHSQFKKMTAFTFNGYMGDKRKTLVEKYGYDCYIEKETEFLTDKGWKKYEDITERAKLGTVDQDGNIEFQKYTGRTDYLYTGKIYTVEPYLTRCSITPNHNLLVSDCRRSVKNNFSSRYDHSKANWRLEPIQSLLSSNRSYFHIRRGGNCRNPRLDVPDSYLMLAGLYISEGSTCFRGGAKNIKAIRIVQTPNGKTEVYSMMRKLSKIYPIKEYTYTKETVWILHGDIAKRIYRDFGHAANKTLPNWCYRLSKEQVNLFFYSMCLGDGCFKSHGTIYYSSCYPLISAIQAMLVCAGILCSLDGKYTTVSNFNNKLLNMWHLYVPKTQNSIHCLHIRKNQMKSAKYKKSGRPVKEYEVTDERVVCFSVPNNTLITRNNGKVAIQGNCKNAAHLIRLLKMGIEFLTEGTLYVERTLDASQLLAIKNGQWTLEQVKAEAEKLFKLCEEAYIRSSLPNEPDYDAANFLCKSIVLDYALPRGEK